ncbi:MAG: M13 family metallopeptidase, partial [Proteobacteria bacterium]|nr:M13 family metallopeptidase [Pseudomonadota bacterium]
MKQTILLTSLLFSLIACNNNNSDTEQKTIDQNIKAKKTVALVSSGIDYSNMDKSIAAKDDFYRHVNGKWLKEFELPADKSNFGSFTILGELSRQRVKNIITELSKSENKQGSDKQKIADIYKSFMNTDALEEKGINAIQYEFDKINAISNRKELSEYVGYADIYTDTPVSMYVYIDKKQSNKHIVYLTQSGIGLPNRDYYFTDNEKSQQIREKYQTHIENMFALANLGKPADSASLVFNIEKDIATGHWTPIENRDSEKTYNKYTFNEVQKMVPNFDWPAWLTHSMIDSPEEIIVSQPSHLETYNQTLLKYSVDQWKTYYQWQLLSSKAPYLNEKLALENFSFFGTVLSGTTEQEPRWKRGVDLANNLTGELIGKEYVKKHFPHEAKDRMVKMIENLREAYGQGIESLDWMSDETKIKA